MWKYHIDKNGLLVICSDEASCKLNSPHFDSMEEGMKYLLTHNKNTSKRKNHNNDNDFALLFSYL